MTANVRWKIYDTSVYAAPTNPAILSFAKLTTAQSNAEVLAGVLYFLVASGQYAGTQQQITQILQSVDDGAYNAVSWPIAEFDALRVTFNATRPVPTGMQLNTTFGAGNNAPLGTSIQVKWLNTIGGRHRGRTYIPWINQGAIDYTGKISGAAAVGVLGTAVDVLGRFGGQYGGLCTIGHDNATPPNKTYSSITSVLVSTTPTCIRSRKR